MTKLRNLVSVLCPPVQYDGTIKHWELQICQNLLTKKVEV